MERRLTRDFNQYLGAFAARRNNNATTLTASLLNTPLGLMVALSRDKKLYLLEFLTRKALYNQIEALAEKIDATIALGTTDCSRFLAIELDNYFNGSLQEFKTHVALIGSAFQQSVWKELQKIPYGQTSSYRSIAGKISKPSFARAVACANSTNRIALIIPCHRVINADGRLGGYAGGIYRKKLILEHEQKTKYDISQEYIFPYKGSIHVL